MKKYELLFVLPGTLDDAEAEAKSREVSTMITGEGAVNAVVTALGKNRLAYPIRQIRYGYFYTAVFESDPEKAKKLADKLALRRELLRAIITYFNADLTPIQKVAYSGETMGTVPVAERAPVSAPVEMAPVVPSEKKPTKEEKPLDLADINKKLDAILSGDNIIPGV